MSSDMRRFWDRRADEDAFFFVDNRMQYRNTDVAAFWTEGERDLDRFLDVLGASIAPEDRVLEIGCGVGRLTRVLAARAASVTALDVSGRMLELAREHNGQLTNVEWVLGDGTTLAGVPDGSIDACVSHVVFQHIPDPQITLGYVREIGRVLRSGGWSGFQISNDPNVHRPAPLPRRMWNSAQAALGRRPGGQAEGAWLGSMVDLGDLRAAAGDGEMEIERVVGEGTQLCLVLTRRR